MHVLQQGQKRGLSIGVNGLEEDYGLFLDYLVVLEETRVLEDVLAVHKTLEHDIEHVNGGGVQVGQDVTGGVHEVVQESESQ